MGLTDPAFDGVGAGDIRYWIGYWKAVRDGRRQPEDRDVGQDPEEHIRLCEAELEARKR